MLFEFYLIINKKKYPTTSFGHSGQFTRDDTRCTKNILAYKSLRIRMCTDFSFHALIGRILYMTGKKIVTEAKTLIRPYVNSTPNHL